MDTTREDQCKSRSLAVIDLHMEADCMVPEARTECEETASVIENGRAFYAAEVKLEHRLTRIVYCKSLFSTFKRFGL